jgi:hypothetical protein
MTTKIATFLAVLLFALLALGSGVASAQAPDGAPHERVQQQRAPAACPPDIQWGCILSGSLSPGLTLNSTSTATSATALYATVTNPGSGAAAVWGRVLGATSTKGYGVYGSHQGSGYGVYGNSNTGIGFFGFSNTNTGMQGETNSTGASPGVLGWHRATSGTGAGVEGRTNSSSTNGVGVLGIATSTSAGVASAGVLGVNRSTDRDGAGVWGSHEGTGWGVWGLNSLGNQGGVGADMAGVYGQAGSSSYHGVYGVASGVNVAGVYGFNSQGIGVHGKSDGLGDWGVYGVASGNSVSAGVVGYSAPGVGVVGDSNHIGVQGQTNGTTDEDVGVVGTAPFSPGSLAWAGYFWGRVHVTGNLSKSGGSFKIDHPLDPENQTLSHSFVESPDMMNIYNGNVTLDANGEAVVEMPAYFQALNRDFRYQLTAIGAPGPNLYIAQKIENNRFRIAGGTPAMEVSWLVTGIRQDPWANENRIPVEEPKPADERGTYLYPEGYGQPESRGLNYEEQQGRREMQDDAPPAPAEVPGQ